MLLGLFTDWSGSQRVALPRCCCFFAAGMLLLARVDEAEGVRLARATESDGT
nr:hypothetical protein [Rhodothermus marinus]